MIEPFREMSLLGCWKFLESFFRSWKQYRTGPDRADQRRRVAQGLGNAFE